VKEHVTAVGILHIGLGVMGLLAAVIVLAATIGPGLIALTVEGDAVPLGILAMIGGVIAVFLVLFSVPGIVGGVALLKHKSWARYLVLILAAVGLVNVPIGTIVGAYTIWVLVQDKTALLFAPEANL
jgi:uncharacterized membrane protein (UPF0136 family)